MTLADLVADHAARDSADSASKVAVAVVAMIPMPRGRSVVGGCRRVVGRRRRIDNRLLVDDRFTIDHWRRRRKGMTRHEDRWR